MSIFERSIGKSVLSLMGLMRTDPFLLGLEKNYQDFMLLLQVCWERQLFKKDSAKSEKYLKEIKGKNGMITV
jgi:hypothetical protein